MFPFRHVKRKSARGLSRRAGTLAFLIFLIAVPPGLLAVSDVILPLVFPPPSHSGVVVGPSSLVELAGYVSSVVVRTPPRKDTPAWEAAYGEPLSPQALSIVRHFRELEAEGFGTPSLVRYLFLHSEPPEFALKIRSFTRGLPPSDAQYLLENKLEVKKLTEGLRRLYELAEIDRIEKRYGKAREAVARAYRDALPGNEPFDELTSLVGGAQAQGPIYLAPSLLAQSPFRLYLDPTEDNRPPIRLSIIPMDDDGIPESVDAEIVRYEEVGYWALYPLLSQFRAELSEVSRASSDADTLLLRALYLSDLSKKRPSLLASARGLDGLDRNLAASAFERGILAFQEGRTGASSFSLYLPVLLDAAMEAVRTDRVMERMRNPGFEEWDGVVLRDWTVEVIEPALTSPVPSLVTKTRGIEQEAALTLIGSADTNQWLGVQSRPLNVTAGDRVLIRAQVRAKGVAPRQSRVQAAHLEARVTNTDGALLRRVAARDLLGTTRWETVTLEVLIPSGAQSLSLACVLTMVGELSFDNIEIEVQRAARQYFLRNGGFEEQSGGMPSDWTTEVAALLTYSGPSVSMAATLDDDHPPEGAYSLRLSGDAQTSQWFRVMSQSLLVSPGQKVTVTGQMRSKNVVLEGRQHRHANLVLTFLSESGRELQTVESELLEGTHDWRRVELEAMAPIEAYAVRVGCTLTMSGQLYFDDLHVSRR